MMNNMAISQYRSDAFEETKARGRGRVVALRSLFNLKMEEELSI